jgi:hypothetical protein
MAADPYRSHGAPAALSVRPCVLLGKVPRTPFVFAAVALVLSFILFLRGGEAIECTRAPGPSGGECRAAGTDFPISEILGMELEARLETRSVYDSKGRPRGSEQVQVEHIMLLTGTGSHDVEAKGAIYTGDRHALVKRFEAFLHGREPEFPSRQSRIKAAARPLFFLAIAAVIVVWAIRQRDATRIEIDVDRRCFAITQGTVGARAPPLYLDLLPMPSVVVQDGWVSFDREGITTPLARLPDDALTERVWTMKVEQFLARVAEALRG